MVTIAQLAEHLVVAQEVVGSSPTGHPIGLVQHAQTLFVWAFFVLSPDASVPLLVNWRRA